MTSWAGTLFAGGAINSLFEGINSAIAGKTSYHYSKKLWDYQTRNQYQNMVHDLYKAGINPMMAVGGLHSSASGNINASGGSSGIEAGTSAKAQMAQVRIAEKAAETDRLKAEAEVKEKDANTKLLEELAKEKRILTPSQNAVNLANANLASKMVLKVGAEIDKIYSDIENNRDVSNAQINQLIEHGKYLNAMTKSELVNVTLLERARDSLHDEIKRDLLSTTFFQYLAGVGYGFELLNSKDMPKLGIGANNKGSVGVSYK